MLQGHDQQRAFLSEIDSATSPLLLSGPEGIGKLLVALEHSQRLNCRHEPGGPSWTPCGNCSMCSRIERGTLDDVQVFRPDGKTFKVAQIERRDKNQPKGVLDHCHFYPAEGAYRVLILDDVEKLTDAAAPALLKTLEDGVPKTVFILVTSALSQVLPTISSRCTHVEFRPLNNDQVRQIIEPKIANQELLDVCVSYSNGSPGAALDFYRVGIPLRADLVKALRKLNKVSFDTLSELVDKTTVEPEMFFEVLISLLLDALAAKKGEAIRNIDLREELVQIGDLIAPKFVEVYAPIGDSLERLGMPMAWPFQLKSILVQMREVVRG